MSIKHWVKAGAAGGVLTIALGAAATASASTASPSLQPTSPSERVALATPSDPGGGQKSKWRFNVVPLAVWGVNIEGPTGIGGSTTYVNASFGDIKDKLNASGGASISAGRGAWTGTVTATYLKFLAEDQRSPLYPGVTAETATTMVVYEGSIAYRLPMGTGKKVPLVEGVGGVRFTELRTTLDLRGAVTAHGRGDVSWTDPYVGFNVAQPLWRNLALVVKGDVGGFSASSNQSKLTWNFTAGAAYRWPFAGWSLTAFGGYKLNQIDYESANPNGLMINQRWEGPVVSVGFGF